MSGPARGDDEDAVGPGLRLPELRRRAAAHARHDAVGRLRQCKAVVDVSQGVGADLAHYAQSNAGHAARAADPARHAAASSRSTAASSTGRWSATWSAATCPPTATTSRRLARVPALQPQGGLRLPGRHRRRLELGRAAHRRAAGARRAWRPGTARPTGSADATPPGHLGAGRVLLARAARRSAPSHRLRGHRRRHRSVGCERAHRRAR